MAGLVLRVTLLLFIPLTAAVGMVQLAAVSNAGYACLVVPVGPDMPEWTLDVQSGRSVWDRRHLNAPTLSIRSSSPDGRYRLGSRQRREGATMPALGWYLEDTHTGTQTPLEHSVGYEVWSADSRTVAYTTLPDETPRQFTVLNMASGAAHTQPLDYGIIMAELSPDGRYLLLQNPSTFEVWALRTADMREVMRATPGASLSGTPWSPQGSRLMSYVGTQPVLYDLDKGTSTILKQGLSRTDRTPVRSIHWAPDGERFALLAHDVVSNHMVLNLFSAAGKLLLPPLDMPGLARHLVPWYLWSMDSTRFAITEDNALKLIDGTAGLLETLIDDIEWSDLIWDHRPPKAVRYLTFIHRGDSGQALTILDLRTLTVASRLIDGAARILPPVWTVDASRIAVKWEDSTGQTRLIWANSSDFIGHALDEPGHIYREDDRPGSPLSFFWLNSGPILLYAAERDGVRSVYILNVETSETHAIASGLAENNPMMTVSTLPDSDRFVLSYRPEGINGAYRFVLSSNDGRYVRDLPPHLVDGQHGGGWPHPENIPVWSPDGTRFVQRNKAGLMGVFDADGILIFESTAIPRDSRFVEWTRCEPRASTRGLTP